MAGQREPIELIMAKGKKHLTKAEIEGRIATEVRAPTDEIEPPSWLKKGQKEEFAKIAEWLMQMKIIGNTDCEALARYIVAKDLYVAISKKLQTPKVLNDMETLDFYSKTQDRFYKQCRSAAMDLGLTISSRCKLVAPQPDKPTRENKFQRFVK